MSPVEHRTHSTFKTLLFTLGFIALSDFLFWSHQGGLSFALLILFLSIGVLWHGSNRPPLAWNILFLGIIPSSIAAGIDWGFCSTSLLLIGLLTLNGEVTFAQVLPRWHRGIEAAWAMIKFPGRIFWLIRETVEMVGNIRFFGSILKWVILGIPILGITLLFSLFLGTGNAILGKWFISSTEEIWKWITSLEFQIGRFFLWGFLLLLGLAIFRPSIPTKIRFWTKPLPSISWEPWKLWSAQMSVVLLIILNGLFFLSNTIDAFYLWGNQTLPQNVSYSSYVHEGVWSLSAAAIFSGLLLAFLWIQGDCIRENPKIRSLGILWVIQNLILLAGVLERLLLYIQNYNLSTQRVYVAVFLLLVAVGFVLIAIMITQNKSVRWLIGSNIISTLILFYVVQFLPVNYWVANYNVEQWFEKREQGKEIDLTYLEKLGSWAVPALNKITNDTDSRFIMKKEAAEVYLRQHHDLLLEENWRKWQAANELFKTNKQPHE